MKQHAEKMMLLAEKAKERADEAMNLHKGFMRAIKEQAEKNKQLDLPAPGSASTSIVA